jgi:hypothetical protein
MMITRATPGREPQLPLQPGDVPVQELVGDEAAEDGQPQGV